MFSDQKKHYCSQKGQTMIELVVAISVILIGVVSTLVLSMATIRGGKASAMRVIAANLAREGIEVVRQKRDSNWLKIESNILVPSLWDQGLKGASNDYTALAVFTLGTPSSWSLDYAGGPDIDTCVQDNTCRLYFLNGIYAQYLNPPAGGWQPTNYYRLLTTNEICKDTDTGEEYIGTCNTGDKKIGIQVISQVKWYEKSNLESLVLEEHLYNWK